MRRQLAGFLAVGASLVACPKDEAKEAPAPAAADAAVAADPGPRWRVFVVQDGLTRPLGPDTGAVKTPVTLKAWLPGQDAKRLSANAIPVGSTSPLKMEFSAAGADAGAVAQAMLAETATSGKVEVHWLSAGLDGGFDTVATSEVELAAAAKPEPEAAPAKPAKGSKAAKQAKKSKKKKR